MVQISRLCAMLGITTTNHLLVFIPLDADTWTNEENKRKLRELHAMMMGIEYVRN